MTSANSDTGRSIYVFDTKRGLLPGRVILLGRMNLSLVDSLSGKNCSVGKFGECDNHQTCSQGVCVCLSDYDAAYTPELMCIPQTNSTRARPTDYILFPGTVFTVQIVWHCGFRWCLVAVKMDDVLSFLTDAPVPAAHHGLSQKTRSEYNRKVWGCLDPCTPIHSSGQNECQWPSWWLYSGVLWATKVHIRSLFICVRFHVKRGK